MNHPDKGTPHDIFSVTQLAIYFSTDRIIYEFSGKFKRGKPVIRVRPTLCARLGLA